VEEKVHIDTHVLVWLYAGETGRFSGRALEVVEKVSLVVSPMCLLEIDYLFEIGRVSVRGKQVLRVLNGTLGVQLAEDAFSRVIDAASSLVWTRDPFDRLIVAQASLTKALLLTKDRFIHRHYPKCLW